MPAGVLDAPRPPLPPGALGGKPPLVALRSLREKGTEEGWAEREGEDRGQCRGSHG